MEHLARGAAGLRSARGRDRVPYYQALWQRRRRQGDQRSCEYLEHWPVLEKEHLRRSPRAFVADDCPPGTLTVEHTSGSTGTPITLFRSRRTVRQRYALYEARHRRWYGVSRQDRWAMIGGRLVTPASRRKPPFWVWNAGLRQLYLSSYHLEARNIPHYLDALGRYRVRYLWGYPSSLHALAAGAPHVVRPDLGLCVVIANAEPLFGHQRDAIQQAFRCPVRETYGMVELVAGAGECNPGRMHLWPEMGWLEVFRGNRPATDEQAGDLVCTSLLDADMPLIRYRTGDRGRLPDEMVTCACGRTLPLLPPIEGRSDDILYTREGRAVGRLDPVFKADLPIREAQVVQETRGRVCIRYVPAGDFTSSTTQLLSERLQARMGPMEVRFDAVTNIPRGPNGKFKAVVRMSSVEPAGDALVASH